MNNTFRIRHGISLAVAIILAGAAIAQTDQPKVTSTPPPKKEKKEEKKEEKREEKEKCQPPGPNVDPFGLPVCKS